MLKKNLQNDRDRRLEDGLPVDGSVKDRKLWDPFHSWPFYGLNESGDPNTTYIHWDEGLQAGSVYLT